MNSVSLPSFWSAYGRLDEKTRRSARKAYHLWAENPFHPSLHFECINREENIWSVRITRGYRAIGILKARRSRGFGLVDTIAMSGSSRSWAKGSS